ncbi:MAG: TetR/AcrR family transcriptional regulator [Sphingomonadaceae bacterium]
MAVTKPKRRQGPGRPVKPLISREAVVRAAVKLIDERGIVGLSVQAVAREIGVQAPSLYYHIKDREELLQMVAKELLREVGESYHADADWEDQLIDLALATRRVILHHANAAPLMLRFFPRSLMLPAYEKTLSNCPYPPEHQAAVLDALEKLTYGASLFEAAAIAHHSPAMPDFDKTRFPHLAKALQLAPDDDETLFVETLRILFDGFRARYTLSKKETENDN